MAKQSVPWTAQQKRLTFRMAAIGAALGLAVSFPLYSYLLRPHLKLVQPTSPAAPKAPRPFTVSIAQLKRHKGIIIPTYINGVGPFQMLLDTGANTSLLSHESLTRLNPKEYRRNAIPERTTFFGVRLDEQFFPQRFRVGESESATMCFYLMDREAFQHMDADMRDLKVDGLLGTDFLQYFAIDFDLARKRLTFYPSGNLPTSERAALGYGGKSAWETALIKRKKVSIYDVDLVVPSGKQETSLPLVFDTGSAIFALVEKSLPAAARPLGDSVLVYGSTRQRRYTPYRLQKARLGSLALTDQPFLALDALPNGAGNGVVGMDFLIKYRFLADFPAQRLYGLAVR